jgi:hypothetical protein
MDQAEFLTAKWEDAEKPSSLILFDRSNVLAGDICSVRSRRLPSAVVFYSMGMPAAV